MKVETAIAIALRLVCQFEGFRARPYLCPAGVATVGYGSTRYRTGLRVSLADPPVTEEAARGMAEEHLRRACLPDVIRCCPNVADEGRVAALLDFVYNLGGGNLAASTLRRRVNSGDWDAARLEFGKWVYSAGVPLAGLVRRRAAEVELI